MNAWELISGIVIAILGCSTLMGYILYRKANKRMMEAEARMKEAETAKKEVEVEKALRDMYEETLAEMRKEYVERINELKASLDDANKRYHDLLVSGAKKDDIIEDKTNKIRELNEVIYTLQQRISSLEVRLARKEQHIEWQKLWHCSREMPTEGMNEEQICESCSRRKPAQPIPLKYIPFKEPVE